MNRGKGVSRTMLVKDLLAVYNRNVDDEQKAIIIEDNHELFQTTEILSPIYFLTKLKEISYAELINTFGEREVDNFFDELADQRFGTTYLTIRLK
ncbi:hypothetical protein [Bulleidia sp. zg-1006]|uniref:hypothetical protein n=2 Tax=Bacteria TaxID=2 RepID=UPI001939652B|nr:hypothetical protein [Bulleidia sp. zg-1006]QRG86235.1 hypothetical protein JOS54_05055 [Bulleidia sp. zg-1006]